MGISLQFNNITYLWKGPVADRWIQRQGYSLKQIKIYNGSETQSENRMKYFI